VTAVNASVTTPDFNFGGATLQHAQMAMTYAAATATMPEQFTLSGGTTLHTRTGQDFHPPTRRRRQPDRGPGDPERPADQPGRHGQRFVQGRAPGRATNPGIHIVGGSLQSLDVTLNGGFALFGVGINPRDLGVHYSKPTGVVQVTGGVEVVVTDKIRGISDAPDGGLTINTGTGAVQVNGLEVQFDVNLGAFQIKKPGRQVHTNTDGVSVAGSGSVVFPAGFAVGGSFQIDHGKQLTEIGLSFDGSVPIARPGCS